MNKSIIAIDVDDVLANSTDAIRIEVNKRLNVALKPSHYQTPGEYWGYYERIWQDHGLGGRITMDELDPQMKADQSHIVPHDSAADVLDRLKRNFKLVVVTSRNENWESATRKWLDKHFPDLFSEIIFAGRKSDESAKSKGEVCREIGAIWLIDDNVEHARAAIKEGIKVILFGNYGWHLDLPEEVVRCKNWISVLEYFDGREG